MANALISNPGALLRRGIGYALLAVSTGCATQIPQTHYPLTNASQPAKNSQGVCVQIGLMPVDGKPVCYQLAQSDLQHHVETLPLDEFGYMFPPLKPETKLASTPPPVETSKVAPATAAANIPITAAPISTETVPSVALAAVPGIAATTSPITKAAPAGTVPAIPPTAAPVLAAPLLPIPSITPAAVPSIAATTVPVTKVVPAVTAPAIPVTAAPVVAAPLPAIAPAAAPSIAATTGPVTKAVPASTVPIIPIAMTPVIKAPTPSVPTPVRATPRYIQKTVHFSTRLPFKLNSAHLSRKNRADLLAFVNSLEQYRGVESIRITGHTDKSGPARFNQWLSGMRAISGQLWVLSLGVDPRTTQVRGVASSEPRPDAHTPADNRYVDLEVVVRVPVP